MSKASVETLLALLSVRLEAFAMCEVESGSSLRCGPQATIVVHYVLRGEGSVECEHGVFPIRAGSMLVVPKDLPKRINGPGPVRRTVDLEETCPLMDGMVKFKAGGGDGDLILGCGSVTATVGDGFGLFDHVRQPLIEEATGRALPVLFEDIMEELARPQIGTKAVVETLMKQVLIMLLRNHLKSEGMVSPLYLPLINPQLGNALMAIVSAPEEPHSVESLARIAGMSRSRFTHHFTASYGRSPIDYVQAVRLRAAARLLRTSALPVKSIASAVGYASRSHLSRAFRKEYGADPTAYRGMVDEPPAAAPNETSQPMPTIAAS